MTKILAGSQDIFETFEFLVEHSRCHFTKIGLKFTKIILGKVRENDRSNNLTGNETLMKNQISHLDLGQGLECDMKCHIFHDFRTSSPFKKKSSIILEIFIN